MRTLLPLLFVVAGCYSTDILLRPPTGPVVIPAEHQDTFHLNVLWVIELSSPVDVMWACNGNPVGVHEEQGIIAAIVNTILPLGVWNTTALCGGGGFGPPAPAGGIAPPPPMGGQLPPPPPPPR